MKVVLYMRYSSDAQTEQSIEGQERVCRDFCNRYGYTIVDTYVDRATSAYKNINKRVQFIKMIQDSYDGKFDAVVVYSVDRFARSKTDHAIYQDKLRQNGVQLLSATENLSGGNERIIVSSVLEAFSEYYSVELSAKVKRGMHESALKCQATGGTRTFGYRTENKKYVLDETESKWVKYIYEQYASGKSISEITDYLNAVGVRTTTNHLFSKTSLQRILHNKKYIGIYVYDDVEVPNGIPRIVSDDLYENVQLRSGEQKNKSGAFKAKTDYRLSLKLFCKKCGSLMFGDSGTGRNGTTYHYYTCSNAKKHLCDLKSVTKEEIEDVVLANVRHILSPDMIDLIAKSAEEFTNKPEYNAERLSLENRIKELERQNANLSRAVVEAYSRTVASLLQQNELELDNLREQLFKFNQEHIMLTSDMIRDYIYLFLNNQIKNVDADKYLVKMFVNKIFYDGENLEIVFNLNNTDSTVNITPKDLSNLEYHTVSSDVTSGAPHVTHTKHISCAYFVAWNDKDILFAVYKIPRNVIRL